jgi:hypothetical protein
MRKLWLGVVVYGLVLCIDYGQEAGVSAATAVQQR